MKYSVCDYPKLYGNPVLNLGVFSKIVGERFDANKNKSLVMNLGSFLDKDGNNILIPLMELIKKRNIEGENFKKFIKNLKDLKAIDINHRDKNGYTAFLHAAASGDTSFLNILLDGEIGSNKDAVDNDGNTALILAARNGHLETVKALLETHKLNINTQNNYGNTALIEAIRHGKTDVANYLIEKGADINICNHLGNNVFTAAIQLNRVSVLNAMYKKHSAADNAYKKALISWNKAGSTALSLSYQKSTCWIWRNKYQKGALGRVNTRFVTKPENFDVNAETYYGKTQLMIALETLGTDECVALIENHKDKIDFKHLNAFGDNVIDCAFRIPNFTKRKAVFEALNTHCTDQIDAAGLNTGNARETFSTLHSRVNNNDKKVSINRGKDQPSILSETTGNHNTRKLIVYNAVYALLKEEAERTDTEKAVIARIKKLRDKDNNNLFGILMRQDIVMENEDIAEGKTPKALVEKLAALGDIDINHKNFAGETALMIAARNGKTELLKELIEKGANINALDMAGNTPLMIAIQHGHIDCINAILSYKGTKGVKLNIANKAGKTAVTLAMKKLTREENQETLNSVLQNTDPNDTVEKSGGKTHLMMMAQDPEISVREMGHFIEKSGKKINLTKADAAGRTIIDYAHLMGAEGDYRTVYRRGEFLKLLFENGNIAPAKRDEFENKFLNAQNRNNVLKNLWHSSDLDRGDFRATVLPAITIGTAVTCFLLSYNVISIVIVISAYCYDRMAQASKEGKVKLQDKQFGENAVIPCGF